MQVPHIVEEGRRVVGCNKNLWACRKHGQICAKKEKIVASSPGGFEPVGFYQELRTEENVEIGDICKEHSNFEMIFM